MTPEEIQKQLADALRDAANKIDPALNPPSETPKPETTEAAQEAHEAAETSFQTRRLNQMNVSLNSHPDAEKPEE